MIRVELHDRNDTLIRVLPGAVGAAYHSVLNSDGAGSFMIHRSDDDAVNLGILTGGIQGYIVHLLRMGPLETGFTDRFAFVVESVTTAVSANDESEAWLTVSGRGTLSLLEDRLAFPPGFNGVSPSTITAQWQNYTLISGGGIMAAEIDRSNPRFSVALTHSVQQSTIGQTVSLRFDNLRKLHDYLVTNGPMDAQMVGVDYRAYDLLGTDKSGSVTLQLGPRDSLLALQLELDSRPVKNWVVAQGSAEGLNAPLAVSTDTASITTLRRREGFVDSRQTKDAVQLGLVAAGAIAQYKATNQRITVHHVDSAHTQVYRDFGLGDNLNFSLRLPRSSWSSVYRVVGIQVADPTPGSREEIEQISLDLSDVRLDYLLRAQKGATLAADSLNVLNRQPQGAPQIDSQVYGQEVDASHSLNLRVYLASDLLRVNRVRLSFFVDPFRSPVAGVNSTTSGASSAASSAGGSSHSHTVTIGDHTHATPNHSHNMFTSSTALGLHGVNPYISTGGQKVNFDVETPPVGTIATDTSTGGATSGAGGATSPTSSADSAHTHGIAHTHSITPSLAYGIFESASTLTNLQVAVNGTDRTAYLGGPWPGNVTELPLDPTWFTVGAWNTVAVSAASGLGRVVGHLNIVSYVQSA